MSTAHRESETWSEFWDALVERLKAIDLTSRSATKFDDISAWLANLWNLESSQVVCKYVQHSKNRWNRLREASRRAPAAILLLLEDGDHGELPARVSEAAAVCSSLRLVLALARSAGGAWNVNALLYRESTSLPLILSHEHAPVPPVPFAPSTSSGVKEPLPPLREDAGERLTLALQSLATTGADPASSGRSLASQALADLTGETKENFAVKDISSAKNLGNRLGEALARTPTVLVVVCSEMLEDRVLEEVEKWSMPSALILVLCGEETRIQLFGSEEELVHRLRGSFGITPDTSSSHVPVDYEPSQANRQGYTDWRTWSYTEWNEKLLDYCLKSDEEDSDPVERLAATPEELVVVVGGAEDEADEIARAFVDSCLSNIPSGRSFYGFCGSKLGRSKASEIPWTPESPDPPYFFAMLWFTCLVAYGYPDAEGGFYERFWNLVGNTDYLQGLPELWLEVWEWSYRRNEAGDPIRVLSLPPKDDFRTTIGESHFLAFPHKHDRRQIARVLMEADLVGFEPPITPVVSRLQAEHSRFSKLFLEDLDHFVSRYVNRGRDPADSAFWRAVRQEALQPSYGVRGRQSRRGATSILGVFDDEGFSPFLGCAKNWTPPPGYRVLPLDNPIGNFEYYAVAENGGLKGIQQVMFESIGLLGPGPRALINQGVLVFQEDQSDEFFLVNGHDVSGADLALVRDDLASAFIDVFGGTTEPSQVTGWSQVTGCTVKPLDEPPPALQSVVHLQRTMSPPTLRFVGGIQVPGGYLGIENFLPRVRAPDANEVRVVLDDRELECERNVDGDWVLPPGLVRLLPVRCNVEGSWKFGEDGVRTSKRVLQLRQATIDDDFRLLAAGHYFMESCRPGQKPIVGGKPIPLSITTTRGAESFDLLDYEPSTRFLGAGLGELSMEQQAGFDWLVVGHKNHPELLVFVGDVQAPTPPANRRSPAPGDRRHWRTAFAKASDVRVRSLDGVYHDIIEFPGLMKLRHRLVRHNPPRSAPACRVTRLDTISMEPPHRCKPIDSTFLVSDALAALSARRSGLRYRTVLQLFEELTGAKDYALHHELIRAWTESGALDLVRSQSYSSTRLVARRPRFVTVRRGPVLEASLIGLVTRARTAQVHRLANERGAVVHEVHPGCPWQPTIVRIRAPKTVVCEIGSAAGLELEESLAWTDGDDVPEHLHVDVTLQELWTDNPPTGFIHAKSWDWETTNFRHDVPTSETGVQVEQRVHGDSCSIYVVVINGSPRLWTHVRNWALLYAHVMAARPPFVLNRSGWLTTAGRAPVHLPTPLGHLCAVLGEGLPGPILNSRTRHVEGYCYPFGRRLTDLLTKVIPARWLKEEVT